MIDKIMRKLGKENINNIKIQEEFEKHKPRWEKMLDKQAFYIKYGMFDQPIVVDQNNVLIDGYTTYLLLKQMGKKYMPVKRV